MNNPELYQKINDLQKRDALLVLQENNEKINWSNNEDTIIDIGSGDGGVTMNVLKKFIPKNYKTIIGCDKSDKMTQFANKLYSDENTSIVVCDIEGDLPKHWRGSFKHAFSFYALHWVQNQKLAFTNVYDLLNEGGDCLLMFSRYSPFFEGYRILARSSKWNYWLKNVERYVSYYQDIQEPEKEIQEMMNTIGFKDIEVSSRKRSYNFSGLDALKNFLAAHNVFPLPMNVFEDYLEDYMRLVKEGQLKDMVLCNIEGKLSVKCDYSILIVYANK